jgi:signal transduction histidine kinase
VKSRVSQIAKQTLGFSREHTTANSSSVAELVQHAITIYEPRCALNGITLEKSLRSMKKIVLRRGEMMQVVSNLIANSMYAMPSGGTLSVSAKDAGNSDDGVVVTIQDTGVAHR